MKKNLNVSTVTVKPNLTTLPYNRLRSLHNIGVGGIATLSRNTLISVLSRVGVREIDDGSAHVVV